MFRFSEGHLINRSILGREPIRNTPQTKLTAKRVYEQFYNDILREDSEKPLEERRLELKSEVIQDNNQAFADASNIRLVNIDPVALFSQYNSSRRSGKEIVFWSCTTMLFYV